MADRGPWIPEEAFRDLALAAALTAPPGADPAQVAAETLGQVAPTFRYVVVDELVGDRALLIASRWPQVDDEGRRLFPARDEDEPGREPSEQPSYQELGVDLGDLQAFLDRSRVGDQRDRTRAVRLGDVYAMTQEAVDRLATFQDDVPGDAAHLHDADSRTDGGTGDGGGDGDATAALRLVVVDVTRSARGAAKAAFSRVIAPSDGFGFDVSGGSEPGPVAPGPAGPADGSASLVAGPRFDPQDEARRIAEDVVDTVAGRRRRATDLGEGQATPEDVAAAVQRLRVDLRDRPEDPHAQRGLALVDEVLRDATGSPGLREIVLRLQAVVEDPRALSWAVALAGLLWAPGGPPRAGGG